MLLLTAVRPLVVARRAEARRLHACGYQIDRAAIGYGDAVPLRGSERTGVGNGLVLETD
jgi:hypothetical protein